MDILRPAPKQPGQMALNAANRLRASIAKAMNQDDVWTLFDIAQGQDHHLLLVQHVHQMLRDLLTALGHDRPDGSVKTPPPGSAAHCAIEYALPAKQQHLLWLCAMIYMALTYLEEYTSDLDNYCWRYFGPVLTAVTTAASLDSDALDRIATRSHSARADHSKPTDRVLRSASTSGDIRAPVTRSSSGPATACSDFKASAAASSVDASEPDLRIMRLFNREVARFLCLDILPRHTTISALVSHRSPISSLRYELAETSDAGFLSDHRGTKRVADRSDALRSLRIRLVDSASTSCNDDKSMAREEFDCLSQPVKHSIRMTRRSPRAASSVHGKAGSGCLDMPLLTSDTPEHEDAVTIYGRHARSESRVDIRFQQARSKRQRLSQACLR